MTMLTRWRVVDERSSQRNLQQPDGTLEPWNPTELVGGTWIKREGKHAGLWADVERVRPHTLKLRVRTRRGHGGRSGMQAQFINVEYPELLAHWKPRNPEHQLTPHRLAQIAAMQQEPEPEQEPEQEEDDVSVETTETIPEVRVTPETTNLDQPYQALPLETDPLDELVRHDFEQVGDDFLTVDQIRAKYHMGAPRLQSIIRRLGLRRNNQEQQQQQPVVDQQHLRFKSPGRVPKLDGVSEETVQEALALYVDSDLPARTVAERMGLSNGYLYWLLKTYGVPRRSSLSKPARAAAQTEPEPAPPPQPESASEEPPRREQHAEPQRVATPEAAKPEPPAHGRRLRWRVTITRLVTEEVEADTLLDLAAQYEGQEKQIVSISQLGDGT